MSKYEEFEALYTVEKLNYYVKQGWELVGNPTSCTHPDTGKPATCWTVGKPKEKKDPMEGFKMGKHVTG